MYCPFFLAIVMVHLMLDQMVKVIGDLFLVIPRERVELEGWNLSHFVEHEKTFQDCITFNQFGEPGCIGDWEALETAFYTSRILSPPLFAKNEWNNTFFLRFKV